MSRKLRYVFWRRNGFDRLESIFLSKKPMQREMVLALKKLRREA